MWLLVWVNETALGWVHDLIVGVAEGSGLGDGCE